jgi:outer membrane translocation and assembly module TamA
VVLISIRHPVHAQSETVPEYHSERIDSVKILRKQYPRKTTWEHIASLPGTIVSIPFVIVFKGAEHVAGYVYDSKIIPKTIDLFTSDDGARELYPTYSNRSGVGLEYVHRRIIGPRSKLTMKVAHAFISKRQYYRFRWRRIQFTPQSPFMFATQLSYRYLPGERFYGIGPYSKQQDKALYDREFSVAFLGAEFTIAKHWEIYGLIEYDHNNTYNAEEKNDPTLLEKYDVNSISGYGTRVKITQFQTGVSLDSRNRLGNPTSGDQIFFYGAYFKDVGTKNFDFWKAWGDINHYIHFGHNRVLKVRLGFEITEPLKNSEVPFYYLSELGEVETIRGYTRGRFRDLKMALGSLEYTIPFWHRIDSFMFVDAGQVGSKTEDFAIKNLNWGIGGGLKLRDKKDVVMILQFAVGREGARVYLNIN